MKKNIPIFCYFLLLLTSCFKTLDFNLDFEGEKIVVRGTISPQDGAIIQISHTLNPEGTYFFDSLDIFLDSAIVKLYENDVFLQQIAYSEGDGFYRNKALNLKMDVDYHLTVEVEGFPPVKTEKIKIPKLPETTFNLISQEEEEIRIDTKLQDNVETTYYQLIVDGIYHNEVVQLEFDLAGSYEQWETCGIISDKAINNFYIKDDCFKGKDFLFPTLIKFNHIQMQTTFGSDLILESAEEVIVRFRSTTNEIYYFVIATDVPEDIDNAFREPAITFSNIIGGHGYFSAYQETVFRHKL